MVGSSRSGALLLCVSFYFFFSSFRALPNVFVDMAASMGKPCHAPLLQVGHTVRVFVVNYNYDNESYKRLISMLKMLLARTKAADLYLSHPCVCV